MTSPLRLVAAAHWFAFLEVRSEVVDWILQVADRFGDLDHPLAGEAVGSAGMWRSLYGDMPGVAAAEARLDAIEARGGTLGPLGICMRAGLAARRDDFTAAYRHVARLHEMDHSGDHHALRGRHHHGGAVRRAY